MTKQDHNLLKVTYCIENVLMPWALSRENWKYHTFWIDKLDKSSPEKLFQDYKDNAPSQCLEQTMDRMTYLLK